MVKIIFKIFLSHSTKDNQIILALEDYLKSRDILLYIAEKDYQIGRRLSCKIIENIENSDYFLILYTNRAKVSGFVNQEIGYWIKSHGFKKIIPLVERGIEPEGFLSGLEYFEFDPNNQNMGLRNIISFIEKIREKELKLDKDVDQVIIGLSLLLLAALISYGIYKLVKK